MILPLEEPVRDQREAGLRLDGDELFGVLVDLLIDFLLLLAPAVEVARRLHERFRARINPWRVCLQLQQSSLKRKLPPATTGA